MIIKRHAKSELQKTIDALHEEMSTVDGSSAEYAQMVDQLVKLHKLQDDITSSHRVTPDTLAIIGANLAGIILIVRHESVNVITSKALSFVPKLR